MCRYLNEGLKNSFLANDFEILKQFLKLPEQASGSKA